jgi:ABC-type Mn2+/Zn2+ transport system ATPase subunit
MSLVAARDLSAAYGPGAPALEDVTFTAEAGHLVGVLGPNGGGKTTLFRALLGELPPRTGEVRLAARPSYVPQTERARLDFPVSARDVAQMGAYPRAAWWRPLARAERAAALRALDRVGLADRADEPFGSLSGGQRQRVLIARALVHDAPVLLLDEPFSGVDRVSEERIARVLQELRDEGRALLIATHDVEQARTFDRVLCLHRRQVAFGRPEDVLTTEALEATYGAEMVVLAEGGRAVAVHHHAH